MTFTDAAAEVLRQVGRPLHYKEITAYAIEKSLLTHVGKNPEVTMGSRLATMFKKNDDNSNPMIRVRPGFFALKSWEESGQMRQLVEQIKPTARTVSAQDLSPEPSTPEQPSNNQRTTKQTPTTTQEPDRILPIRRRVRTTGNSPSTPPSEMPDYTPSPPNQEQCAATDIDSPFCPRAFIHRAKPTTEPAQTLQQHANDMPPDSNNPTPTNNPSGNAIANNTPDYNCSDVNTDDDSNNARDNANSNRLDFDSNDEDDEDEDIDDSDNAEDDEDIDDSDNAEDDENDENDEDDGGPVDDIETDNNSADTPKNSSDENDEDDEEADDDSADDDVDDDEAAGDDRISDDTPGASSTHNVSVGTVVNRHAVREKLSSGSIRHGGNGSTTEKVHDTGLDREGMRRRRRRRRRSKTSDLDAFGGQASPGQSSHTGQQNGQPGVAYSASPMSQSSTSACGDSIVSEPRSIGTAAVGPHPVVLDVGSSSLDHVSLDDLGGKDMADAIAIALSAVDRASGPVSLRQLSETAQRRGRPGTDLQQLQSQIAASVRADNLRRVASGLRPRFRFVAGRVALTDWLLNGDLARLEQEAIAAVERYREASRKTFVRKIQELSGPAFVELVLLVFERMGFRCFRAVRRAGIPQQESHFAAIHETGAGQLQSVVAIRRDGREIGRERVSELRGTLHYYGPASMGTLVTAGTVLSGAREEAAVQNAASIVLHDGTSVAKLCEQQDIAVVRSTLPICVPDLDILEALRSS